MGRNGNQSCPQGNCILHLEPRGCAVFAILQAPILSRRQPHAQDNVSHKVYDVAIHMHLMSLAIEHAEGRVL